MIRGNSIRLRALEPKDVDIMMIYENDADIWPVSGTLVPYSRYTIEQYYTHAQQDIFTTRQLRLAIEILSELPEPGVTIGYIDLFDFDPQHRRAGVGILIGEKEQRRKGYATEALRLLVNYAFNTLNLHQLHCHIEMNNDASMRLFSSCGFRVCGVLRDWIVFDGKWHSVSQLQILRPEPLI